MKKLLVLAIMAGLAACTPEAPKTEKPAEPAPKAAVPETPKTEEPKPAETKTEPPKTEAKTATKTEPAAKTPAAPKTETKPEAKAAAPKAGPTVPASTLNAPATGNANASVYRVLFTTSKGDFVIEVNREWAPLGAERFYELVKSNFFDDVRFFRVISDFMVQFGIPGDPKVAAEWRSKNINDDPVKQSNTRGMVTFATGGPNTRTTQVFISLVDRNARLDRSGFSPFGKVVSGMDVVDKLYSGYGEGAPDGIGPRQDRTQLEGNAYLNKDFPMLDYVKTARITK